MQADRRVGRVTYNPGEVFVELAPGWHWSQQQCFGCDTIKEAWTLIRASEYDPEGYGRPGGVDAMRAEAAPPLSETLSAIRSALK